MSTFSHNPEDEAVSAAIRQALLEIHIYKSKHPSEESRQASIESLAAIGAISSPTLSFMRRHEARFFGLPQRTAGDVAVFEVVLAGKRVVGFSDGHVEIVERENEEAACGDDAA